jgi:outer membrane PBP1 activator LpoA protein
MEIESKRIQIFAMHKIRLCISIIMVSLFLASCNSITDNNNKSPKDNPDSISLTETQNASLDSTVHYLLDASAKDFHDNQPPIPVSFRNVQVRNLIGSNMENHYMICGQFLAQDNQTKDEWTSFATIKTSGYEQWIGNQSLEYCQDSKAISYKIIDLSSALKKRVDSLQNLEELKK